MNTILLCMPIKKDKIVDFEASVKELLGLKKKDYKELHVRYGIKATKIWAHALNDNNYIMLTHELSDDLETQCPPNHRDSLVNLTSKKIWPVLK